MARVLALTQLLIVSLEGPALYLLVKIEHKNMHPEVLADMAQLLARHVLWLFAIPILYAAIGTAVSGRVSDKVIHGIGIAICVILVALLGILIVFYLL